MSSGWRIVAVWAWLAEQLDRSVARVLPGGLAGTARRLHFGVGIAGVVLLAIAGQALLKGWPYLVPRTVDVANLPVSPTDLNVTVSGVVADVYIETYRDLNRNRARDPNETSFSWLYFLGVPGGEEGIVVESATPPDAMFAQDSVTLTGRLTERTVNLDDVPEFDLADVPFRLNGGYLYEGEGFPEAASARDSVVVLGGVLVLIILGAVLGYPIFRPARVASPVESAPMVGRPVAVRLTGDASTDGRWSNLAQHEAVALAHEDPFGRRWLVFAPAGRSGDVEPIASFPAASTTFVAGESWTPGGSAWSIAVSRRSGRLVAVFSSLSDRDGTLAGLDASHSAATAAAQPTEAR